VAPASEPVAVVVPPAAASASLLIDQVPGGFAEHAAAPASPTTPAPGDHDGMTVSRGQLQRLQAEAPLDPHSVLAVLCPQGDPNPPNAQQCRICQRLIADQEPRPVSRPALGWLLFSTGAEARLDRPVIIGRAPRAERVSSDAVPQLVTLASPGHEISRSHVEVRLEGWHVLVRDLGSANGTVVTLPDRPPERLHAGEAVPIVPGTSVSIADEVRFTYMVDR
jgi:hypothetical protein